MRIGLATALVVAAAGGGALAGGGVLGVSHYGPIPGYFLDRHDVDGDGLADVVFVGGDQGGFIGYRPGLPGGGYGDPVTTTGLYASFQSANVARLSHDGPPVLAVCAGYTMRFYAAVDGAAEMLFDEQHLPGSVSGWDNRQGVRVGDLDGDGLHELLLQSSQNRCLIRWSSRPVHTRYQPILADGPVRTLPIRDYDGDGFADVLFHCPDMGGLVICRGTGTDKLGPPEALGVLLPASESAQFIDDRFGRFDDNAALDVVAVPGGELSEIVIRLNFATPEATSVVVPMPESDWRFDGVIEDIGGHGADGLRLRGWRLAIPSYEPAGAWLDPLGPNGELIEVAVHAVSRPWSDGSVAGNVLVRTVDVDGDGHNDLMTYGDEISVLLSNAGMVGTPPIGASLADDHGSMNHTLAVDLNGDGLPELFHPGPNTPRVVNPRDLSAPAVLLDGVTGGFMGMVYRPVEDGLTRVAFGGNGLRIASFHPDGSLAGVEAFSPPGEAGYLMGLGVGDFDGDGSEDLVATVGLNAHLFRSAGDGGVEWYATVEIGESVKPGVADLNGDGLADLVIGEHAEDRIRVLRNLGDGVFELVQTIETTASFWVHVEDIDGDGLPDLVGAAGSFQQGEDVSAAVWFGRPDGTFGDEVVLRMNVEPVEVGVADLDGDGLKDVVLFGDNQRTPFPVDRTVIYTQTAPRQFEYAGRLPTWAATGGAIADFNDDGAPDVATVSGALKRTFVQWGRPAVCAADFNASGSVDVFDLLDFAAAFAAGDLSADVAGPFGVIDVFDLLAFMDAFLAGCP